MGGCDGKGGRRGEKGKINCVVNREGNREGGW